ncbi:MAG: hypothetical protein ACREXY_01465 [Gammaproteobacteria bacterium]
MKNYYSAAGFAALAMLLSGCGIKGGWMGAAAEKDYDKELEIKRLAEVLNNEDYYEFEREGRIYVLSDSKDYNTYLKTNEVVLSTKKIGGGPDGKTIVYGLIKNEAKMMEKDPKSQGAAQKMYEGKLRGLDKDFFGVVVRNDTYYVFSSWKDLESFKTAGAAMGFRETDPAGHAVIYVGAPAKPEALSTRFAKAHAP